MAISRYTFKRYLAELLARTKTPCRGHLSLNLPTPSRLPILYVILSVLVLISIVPMYFYSAKVESINGERLKTNEQLLQNTVTRSLADDLVQHQRSLHMMLANLSSAIQIASGGDIETSIRFSRTPRSAGKFCIFLRRYCLCDPPEFRRQGNLSGTNRS